MRCEVVNEAWLPARPFWSELDPGYRIAVVDVPMTVAAPGPINGLQLAGWGTHDLTVKGSWPPELWGCLEKEFGASTMPVEYFGPQSAKTLFQLREDLLRSTEQLTRITEKLLAEERWDLFLVVYGAPHRAGHYLWDLSQISAERIRPTQRERLERALTEIYRSCDQALGRLLERAPPGTRIMVFAVHGMAKNPGWSDLCPEILTRIQQGKGSALPRTGLLYRLKRRVPFKLIRQGVSHLPRVVQNRLVSLWSAGMFHWSTTRYFPVPMDHAGYVRINLQGREPQGIVQPGDEYSAVCGELEAAFLSLRDLDTGEPIVDRVIRAWDIASLEARYRDLLPDLVILWRPVSAIKLRGVVGNGVGEIRGQGFGRLPSGRSGNHSNKGWFVAVGNGIEPRSRADGHPITNLVPTVFQWLGAEPAPDFQGRPIPALVD